MAQLTAVQSTLNASHPALNKYRAAVSSLASPSVSLADQLQTVRFIKNSIIGNSSKKVLFLQLGVIPKLVDILSSLVTVRPSSLAANTLMTQVSIVLGSFAYGSDVSVETLVNAGAMKPLLEAMISADLELAEASARALKILLQNPGVPREEVMHSEYIDRLVGYLGGAANSAILVELSASIVARCCESATQQEAFQSCGAVDHILSILSGGVASPRTLEACLDALAALLRQNVVLARSIVASKSCDVC
eukprot:Partr_v1_DN28582_c0_g1_i2_m73238 putative Armadillo repeat containing 8